MKPEGNIRIEITHNIKYPNKSLIKTNVNKKMISGILGEWTYSQIGRGENKKEVKKRDIYRIIIELDLRDDTFRTTSNTGNADLTAGIILSTKGRLDEILIVESY